MATTKIDGPMLDQAIKMIEDIIGDDKQKNIDDLKGLHPNAGDFSTAESLEEVVDDRRNALVANHRALRYGVFHEMKIHLTEVKNLLEDTDQSNAVDKIKSMKDDITKDVLDKNKETEKNEHNFSPNGDPAGVNPFDGDGYDDNVTFKY